MSQKFRISILLCISLWLCTTIVSAHSITYATDQLKDMSQAMNISVQIDALSSNDTIFFKYNNKTVNLRTKNGRINHIGYCIFTQEQRAMIQSPVFDFLERYVLALDLPLKRVKPINNQLAEDEITFSGGEISSMPQLYNDSTLNLSINLIEDKRYNVAWERDNLPHFSIEFPVSYDLLHGTEMSENERRLAEDLNMFSISTKTIKIEQQTNNTPKDYDLSDFRKVIPIELLERKESFIDKIFSIFKTNRPPQNLALTNQQKQEFELSPDTIDINKNTPNENVVNAKSHTKITRDQLISNDNINFHILPGETYYFADLNSNKYYKQDSINGEFSLIFTPSHPTISISNLFTTGEIENSYNVDVTLKQYGFKQTQLTIPVNDFVNYFIGQGCKPFFGLMEDDDDKIVGLLIMLNRAEGYCHTIRITCDVNILLDETKKFSARVVSYIPVSRIKTLYEENEK